MIMLFLKQCQRCDGCLAPYRLAELLRKVGVAVPLTTAISQLMCFSIIGLIVPTVAADAVLAYFIDCKLCSLNS